MKKLILMCAVGVALLAFTGSAAIPDLVLTVGQGETLTLDEAVAAQYPGVTDPFAPSSYLIKKGLGTLVGTATYNATQNGVKVYEGTYSASADTCIGANTTWIYVSAGATFETSFAQTYSRRFHIAGTGAAGKNGAVLYHATQSYLNHQFCLDADATLYTDYTGGYTRALGKAYHPSLTGISVDFGGHTMRLAAAANAPGFAYGDWLKFLNSGTLLVDGTALAEVDTYMKDNEAFEAAEGADVTLCLKDGASFLPRTQKFVACLKTIDAEAGTKIAGNESPFDMSIANFAGAAAVGDNVSSFTVEDRFTVRASDLVAGECLTVDGELVFDAACELGLEGDLRNLNPDADGMVTIASSSTGISGCPTLVPTPATRHWRVAAHADGKRIVLVHVSDVPAGAIDVRTEWGVKAGAEGVDGNAARFNEALAALPADAKPILYFSEGDYYFDEPLVIARDDVALVGDFGDSVLHAADNAMTTVLSVTDASCVSIGLMGFADCAGTAVSASGTTALQVTNNFYTAIGGTIANVAGTHPVCVKNGADTCVKFNRVTDEAVYTSLAYHDGGTKTADSDPYSKLRLWVDAGEIEDFIPVYASMGLGTPTPTTGAEKWGPGTLISTNLYGTGGIAGFEIKEGVTVMRECWDFGKHSYGVFVNDGTTLECTFKGSPYAKGISLYGHGAPGEAGAVVCKGNPSWQHMTFHVYSDSTIATEYAGDYTAFFRRGSYNASYQGNTLKFEGSGNVLRLIAADGCPGFCYGNDFILNGKGTILVDGTAFAEKNTYLTDENAIFTAAAGTVVGLKLVNGASFLPNQQEFVSLLASIDAEYGTTVNGNSAKAAFDMSIASFAGAATVGDKVSSLTVSDRLTVRCAEAAAGHALAATGALVFGPQSVLELEGDLSALVPDADGKVVIATSAISVMGCPTLNRTTENRHWSVASGTDGKSLVLVYDSFKPEGAIDVRADWGVLTGEDNVEGNAGRFNAALAACETANPVLYFPEGHYYFDEPLSIGAKDGVTILGDNYSATLHGVGEGQKTVLSVAAAQGLNVCYVGFAGCAGTAISASGTTALAVSNCLYTAIGGAIDNVAGLYPIEVRNGTSTMIHANRVTDGQAYAAAAYYAGGTKAEGCEPVDGEVHLWVDAGETEEFDAALAKAGYAAWPDMTRVVKEGPGTLVGTSRYTAQNLSDTVTSRIRGLTVEAGVMRIAGECDLGYKSFAASDRLIVKPGATCVVYGNSGWGIQNRGVHLAGSGFPGMGGALVITGKAAMSYIQFYLDDDAVVCTKMVEQNQSRARLLCTSNAGVSPFIYFYGHKLTLKCADGVPGYLLERRLKLWDSGTLEVDGTDLYETRESVGFTDPERGTGVTTLKLVNGGTYTPKTQNTVSLFDNIETDEDTRVDALTENLAMTVAGWKGLGTVAGLASLTVTNVFTSESSELLAGKYPTLACPLVFGANAKLRISDPDGLFAAQGTPARYMCAESSVSLAGRPHKDRESDFTKWKPGVADNVLYIDTYPGMAIIVR